MTKKTIGFIFLCLAVLTTALTGCGSGKTGNTDLSESGAAESTPETEEVFKDGIPGDGLNFDGYNIRMFVAGPHTLVSEVSSLQKFVPESENGDIVNDTLYRCILEVKERLNVNFTVTETSELFDFISKYLIKTVSAGDDAYDLTEVNMNDSGRVGLITGSCLTDLNDLPYVNWEDEWHFPAFTELFTVYDSLYMTPKYTSVMEPLYLVFNKNMMADLSLESPYRIALDGGWTYDVLLDYVKDVYSDVNGSGKEDQGDRFGMYNLYDLYDTMMAGLGLNTVSRNDDGTCVPLLSGEKLYDCIQKILDLKNLQPDVYVATYPLTADKHMFMTGSALFSSTGTGAISLRDIDSFDFGVLPYPKYDGKQENYCSYVWTNCLAVPSTAENTEPIGAVTEALYSSAYRNLYPVYTEVYINQKILRDEESASVFNMMREPQNLFFDYTYYLDFSGGTITYFSYISKIKNNDIVSSLEKIRPKTEEAAQKFFDDMKALQNE